MQWKKNAARAIRKMSAQDAVAAIARINEESRHGQTIIHAEIRALTGGFNSQAINFYILRLLGKKAGICT